MAWRDDPAFYYPLRSHYSPPSSHVAASAGTCRVCDRVPNLAGPDYLGFVLIAMNAATSVPPILPATTERHEHQVPQPPQPVTPVHPPQKPAPTAIPDHPRIIQQPMICKDEKGKGRLTEGKRTSPQLASWSTMLATPPKHAAREPIISSTVYKPTEKADNRDDYRHHTSSSYASDPEKQSYDGYGIPSENEYLTVSNHPNSICMGRGNGVPDSSGDVDRHLRRIIV